MNKGKIFLAFSMIAVTLCGCGMGNVGSSSEDDMDVEPNISQEGYEDTLDGLCKLLYDNGLISGEAKEMSAEFIRAEKGVKYQFKINKSEVDVEVYDYGKTYDLLDDKAKEVIQGVRSNEKIVIVEEEFPAVASKSGRYLMIYKDTSNDKDNLNKAARAKEIVKDFKY